MKLLFVHEWFGALAGAEANLQLTAAELNRRGHSVGILHGPGTGKGETAWQETFAHRFAISTDDRPASVREALRTFDPEIVYIHKLSDLDALELLLASGVPLVRMVHDHDLYCMRSYKYNYFSRRICTRAASPHCVLFCGAFLARNHGAAGFPLRWVSYAAKKKEIRINRQFHKLIVNSHYLKGELLRNGFAADKIEVHAPAPRPGNPDCGSSFGNDNLILYAGQIIRGKGVDVLLESLARVRVPFECLILGDGNHRPFCEALSHTLGLADRVHFKGYVSPAELEKNYRQGSVAAVSSVWPEPFGMAGIEAIRYGLPVVAFDAGGIREWLIDGQNGFLVPWMDRARYAARVEQLLCDKVLARQMGERGRQLVAQQHDFQKYIGGLENLFAGVIARAQRQVVA